MSDVTSLLTTANRKELSQLLGKVNLHLLYKATVHGFDDDAFHAKCDKQGPTITVGYNKSGFIFGGYRGTDFGDCSDQVDNKTFLFRIPSEGKVPVYAVKKDAVTLWSNRQALSHFGYSLLHLLKSRETYGQYSFLNKSESNFLAVNDKLLIECEAYRVEELKTPWRHLTWTTGKRQEQINFIESYKPYMSSVSKARVLLIGPIGAGKSSFINSVNSIFRGHVTSRVLAGSGPTSTTTMFKAASPINADTADYIKSPTVGGRIHCVVYVINAGKVTECSTDIKNEIRAIRSQINKLEVPQVVLLTKVDEECPLIAKDLENVYHSDHIEKKVSAVGQQLGIPISCIIPMKNYWSDHELHYATDILILSALVQILRYADDYFENLHNLPSNI
ncbi:interferon-induced protein 44-like isoform X2 [Mustelus asterias]